MLRYPVDLSPDDGTWLVVSPDFPELVTFGETVDDALIYAIGAFEEVIAARVHYREDVPTPSRSGSHWVALPTQTALKVLLWQAMRQDGVGKAELARRMNRHLPQIDRLLDLNHASRIDQFDDAFHALGRRIGIELEKAA